MTEEELARLRTAKAEATERLKGIRLSKYRLGDADKRITQYCREVADNPDRHCLWEQLSVLKFLRMVEKYGLKVSEVKKFFTFYEYLKFPGKRGDTRYKLTPVQAFQFANIFGFWKDGRRVVKEVCLFVPRKFSKTTGTASLAMYDLLYGEANGEAYVGANSFDQAKKCFDVIRGSMRHLDPNGKRYQVNEQRIKSRRPDRTAFCQCLTASARTKDGLNASTVIMDEFSQAKNNELLTVLTTSMGVRENPLSVIITTASDVFNGPFYAMLQGYKAELLGDVEEDDHLFAHLFEPDIDDDEGSEETWRKVHPHIGVTVGMDFYRQEWRKAQRDGAMAMLAFRTKLLNIYSDNPKSSWLAPSLISKYMAVVDPNKFKVRPRAMVAIDLSVSDDFSAVSFATWNSKSQKMAFHTDYFFPEGALPGHPNERLYRAWAERGYLRLLKGDVIDYDAIAEHIIELNDKMVILKIGYDRYKSRQMLNDLQSHPMASGVGNALQDVSQTYGAFTAPVESFEYGLKTGGIVIDDNPITLFCFGNAVIDIDKMENKKPIKRSDNMKIDGVITMLMCLRLWLDVLQPPLS